MDGKASLVRFVPIEGNAAGMVLTHDGKLLIITDSSRVAFLDTKLLIRGRGNPILGYWSDSVQRPGHVYDNLTSDDAYLFVSDEGAQTITVINLAKARTSGFGATSVVGKIPVGWAPIALTFSVDERYLYTTSQVMPPTANWPDECKPANAADSKTPPNRSQGAILVVDVAKAKSDPANSVVSTVKAGCSPVRLAISPKGNVAYVTARADNALLVFDTEKLVSDSQHALIGSVPVGSAPVGVAVIDQGRKVVVANSNRFAGGPDDQQTLTVIDAAKISLGTAAVLGTIPAGSFPREIRVTSDGRTLLLTNFGSRTLEIVDLTRLPINQRQ
jgi:DNA-binding beta-propeller fold protein YncE